MLLGSRQLCPRRPQPKGRSASPRRLSLLKHWTDCWSIFPSFTPPFTGFRGTSPKSNASVCSSTEWFPSVTDGTSVLRLILRSESPPFAGTSKWPWTLSDRLFGAPLRGWAKGSTVFWAWRCFWRWFSTSAELCSGRCVCFPAGIWSFCFCLGLFVCSRCTHCADASQKWGGNRSVYPSSEGLWSVYRGRNRALVKLWAAAVRWASFVRFWRPVLPS